MPKNAETNIAVLFKNCTPSKAKRALGVEIAANEISRAKCLDLFVGAQLQCHIEAAQEEDDQQTMGDIAEIDPLEFIADCKHVTVLPDEYRLLLHMPLDAVDPRLVEKFRFRKGTLTATRTGNAASDGEDE